MTRRRPLHDGPAVVLDLFSLEPAEPIVAARDALLKSRHLSHLPQSDILRPTPSFDGTPRDFGPTRVAFNVRGPVAVAVLAIFRLLGTIP